MSSYTEAIEKGARAKVLLEDPLLLEVLAAYRDDLYKRWCSSEEEQERSDIWYEQRATNILLLRLNVLVDNGRIAAEQLKEADGQPA